MSRITIRDIAKLLEVSPSTVSRALKDHPDIGTATKAKINQVAKDLGYVPNYQAIQFRQRKSKLIGLILPEMGRFFAPDMVKAIEEITSKKGYHFIIFQSNELLEKEKECVTLCQSFGIDGLLVAVTKATNTMEHFNPLIQHNIPLVFVDKVVQKEGNATVMINDFDAAFNAINHLAKRNYKYIAGVFDNENLMITQQRKAGFKAALNKHHLPFNADYCLHFNQVAETKAIFRQLLKATPKPDAVFAMSDEILTNIIQVIYEEGLTIPQDIAVICISNGYVPYYINPKITFIKHSGYQIGQAAANLLIDLIEHPQAVIKKQLEISTYLVELDSC
jgi:LacI family transcriptional regulator